MAEPPILLDEIPLGRREVLRVTREIERGHQVVNLRVWFTAQYGEARPGRDGIAMPVDRADALVLALGRLKSSKS